MFIALAKIPEREGSISLSSYRGEELGISKTGIRGKIVWHSFKEVRCQWGETSILRLRFSGMTVIIKSPWPSGQRNNSQPQRPQPKHQDGRALARQFLQYCEPLVNDQ